MRKLFAILLALALAVTLAVFYGAWRQGIAFRDLDLNQVKEILVNFKNQKTKEPSSPSKEPVIEIVEEESLSYDERLEKGNYFFERGFLTFAANEYGKAASLEPERPEPYLKLIQTNFDLGDYEKARRSVDTLFVLNPQSSEADYWLARIHLKQGAYEEARLLLEKLAAGLEDPELDYHRTLLKIISGQFQEAEELLSRTEGKPVPEELREKLDRLRSAFQEFHFAQAAETLYLDELLARAMNQNGEYELAITVLKKVLKTRPDLRDAWVLLGFAYLNLEEHYFALTSFERAYELDSEWPTAQYFLAITYQELGQFDQAVTYFNYALSNQFEPQAVVQQKLAELYLEMQKYEEASRLYREVLEENKGDIQSFVRPIWLYLDRLNEPQEALQLAELALVTFPENPMAYNLLGWAQTGTGDYAKAEENLKKALELDPGLAAAHLNLAKLYEAKGLISEATTEYQQAYTLDPNGSIGQLAAQKYNELINTQ